MKSNINPDQKLPAKVSVIVPVYNVEVFLRRCVDSILLQTYPNLEIIIVNDASTDHTLSVIKRYANQDNRIRFIDKQVNGGVSLARNDALHIASGTYLMFVDGDDWLEPHTCEVAIQSCQENKADIVMWSYIREMIGGSHPTILFDSDRAFISGDSKSAIPPHGRSIWSLFGAARTSRFAQYGLG